MSKCTTGLPMLASFAGPPAKGCPGRPFNRIHQCVTSARIHPGMTVTEACYVAECFYAEGAAGKRAPFWEAHLARVAMLSDEGALLLSERTHVVGMLNVTPDSFSDGGRYANLDAAVSRAAEMEAGGADIIDVGGESTRPGAQPVAEADELQRVIPVIEALVREVSVPISVDTTKAAVAEAALEAGAVIVNDVTALRGDRHMVEVVAKSKAGLVLMHMLGEPRTMQQEPRYGDVVAEVSASLLAWAKGAEASGVEHERIVIDPGIGFGKTDRKSTRLNSSHRCISYAVFC